MHILFITETFPYPTDTGGKIRSFNILRGLSQQHEVTLLTTYASDDQLQYVGELERFCTRVHAVPKKKKTLVDLGLIVLKNLFSRLPLLVEQHFNTALSEKISEILSAHGAEIRAVHFDHLDSTIYLGSTSPDQLKILDEHNVVTNQVITSSRVEKNPVLRYLLKSQISKTRRYETEMINNMDLCFVCSDADRQYLRDFSVEANLEIIPNGVDISYFSQPQHDTPPETSKLNRNKTLVFVGTLDYGPGESAVLYFLEQVYPLLRAQVPDINFIAVGQNPSNRLLKHSSESIIFTGRVDDIRPYVANACIFIVPLLSGSGTRLKILDAMSMQIPVVSTSIGAEGLDVRHEKDIMIADTPEDFVQSTMALLEDQNKIKELIDNGFRLVNEHYAWEIVWKKLLNAYNQL